MSRDRFPNTIVAEWETYVYQSRWIQTLHSFVIKTQKTNPLFTAPWFDSLLQLCQTFRNQAPPIPELNKEWSDTYKSHWERWRLPIQEDDDKPAALLSDLGRTFHNNPAIKYLFLASGRGTDGSNNPHLRCLGPLGYFMLSKSENLADRVAPYVPLHYNPLDPGPQNRLMAPMRSFESIRRVLQKEGISFEFDPSPELKETAWTSRVKGWIDNKKRAVRVLIVKPVQAFLFAYEILSLAEAMPFLNERRAKIARKMVIEALQELNFDGMVRDVERIQTIYEGSPGLLYVPDVITFEHSSSLFAVFSRFTPDYVPSVQNQPKILEKFGVRWLVTLLQSGVYIDINPARNVTQITGETVSFIPQPNSFYTLSPFEHHTLIRFLLNLSFRFQDYVREIENGLRKTSTAPEEIQLWKQWFTWADAEFSIGAPWRNRMYPVDQDDPEPGPGPLKVYTSHSYVERALIDLAAISTTVKQETFQRTFEGVIHSTKRIITETRPYRSPFLVFLNCVTWSLTQCYDDEEKSSEDSFFATDRYPSPGHPLYLLGTVLKVPVDNVNLPQLETIRDFYKQNPWSLRKLKFHANLPASATQIPYLKKNLDEFIGQLVGDMYLDIRSYLDTNGEGNKYQKWLKFALGLITLLKDVDIAYWFSSEYGGALYNFVLSLLKALMYFEVKSWHFRNIQREKEKVEAGVRVKTSERLEMTKWQKTALGLELSIYLSWSVVMILYRLFWRDKFFLSDEVARQIHYRNKTMFIGVSK